MRSLSLPIQLIISTFMEIFLPTYIQNPYVKRRDYDE